jgi:hypothetical protein
LISAAILFAIASFGFSIVSYVPRVVLSATIMVIAVQHIDSWSLDIFRRIRSGVAGRSRWLVLDLSVMMAVAALSVTINIVLALFIGIFTAAALFIVRMSRSVVRRRYAGDTVHSRKARTPEEAALLERRGTEILILELQGVIFFGSGELLSDDIARSACGNLGTIVLDLRRVTEVDATGARILGDIHASLAVGKLNLLLALPRNADIAGRLAEIGTLALVGNQHVFDDVDRALEWAEDELIKSAGAPPRTGQGAPVPLASVDLLSGMTPAEISVLEQHVQRQSFSGGTTVFAEGDPGSGLFVVTEGHASAYLKQAGAADIRLATFAPGTIFGELAILDSGPRSASIIADDDLACLVLSQDQFSVLTTQAPSVAIKLLAGLGRELSHRLRRANRTIHELES